MSQSTENIEAKLCAYIEGDLDPAGQAEIEKHLSDNPQHRQLMSDLMRTRELLRDLPRQAAPDELAEALQGQLERSVLLDDAGMTDSAAMLRINRWPQFAAIAAILAMAVGLGAVVYLVISPQDQKSQLVIGPAAGPAAVDSDIVKESGNVEELNRPRKEPEERGKDGAADDFVRPDGVNKADLPESSVSSPMPMGKEGGAKKSGNFKSARAGIENKKSSRDSFAEFAVKAPPVQKQLSDSQINFLRQANSTSPNTMFVVVSTKNLSLTNSNVTNYLNSNSVSWQPAPESSRKLEEESRNQLDSNSSWSSHLSSDSKPESIQQAMSPLQQLTQSFRQNKSNQDSDKVAEIDNVYIVRGVTQQQAMELSNSLSQQQAGQRAEIVNPNNHSQQLLLNGSSALEETDREYLPMKIESGGSKEMADVIRPLNQLQSFQLKASDIDSKIKEPEQTIDGINDAAIVQDAMQGNRILTGNIERETQNSRIEGNNLEISQSPASEQQVQRAGPMQRQSAIAGGGGGGGLQQARPRERQILAEQVQAKNNPSPDETAQYDVVIVVQSAAAIPSTVSPIPATQPAQTQSLPADSEQPAQ